jgi:hypothetical protein
MSTSTLIPDCNWNFGGALCSLGFQIGFGVVKRGFGSSSGDFGGVNDL